MQLTLPLSVPHCNAVRVAPSTPTDTDKSPHTLRVEYTRRKTLHAAHARAYACVQLLNP